MITFLYMLIIFFVVVSAKKVQFLNSSGSIAAFFVGICIALGLGYKGLLLLGAFFLSSSLLSKYKKSQKIMMEEKVEKGSERDAFQVLANGGAASFASLVYLATNESLWIYLFAIFIAASNSDTWASEIGTLSKKQPLSIKNFRLAETGTSGAVSALGTAAAICGSFFIAVCTFFLFSISVKEMIIIGIFGFVGNLLDTLLGALLQAEYQCKVCEKMVEKKIHCGKKTVKRKGFTILNNDIVNILSGVFAALLALFVLL
ncbi:DUF92 domain-containing protein [Niallia sp. NCCP-28]|uniref:DUF92 domain-containing protein n=1 Tax=Niallia sp. NCCP-28 TaxID=2934712 RepID=UPI00208541AB|nr:DUF92 domain-containing protein [Niallia sp. NCCP-28]GKU81258.1 hypothetical protein NCCP28_06540 [Niallia sp. NCCP-28]